MSTTTAIGPISNGAQTFIEMDRPYVARVEVTGVADILFHTWNCESILAKSKARKGSDQKKTDDVESYVVRDAQGHICIPGAYLQAATVLAAKFRQDPRSPRKSAQDLFKAAFFPITTHASLGTKTWDFEHRCRVQVQRAGVTRVRPAMRAGWKATFDLQVVLPEYVPPDVLHDTITNAGRLCGLGDYRPTYGRFQVTRFEVL